MISIGDSIPGNEPDNGLTYDDFEEKLPWTGLTVPENPNIALHIRVLHAFAQKSIGKPQHRFAVEYLTLGRVGYEPTEKDGHMAHQHAQNIVNNLLTSWSGGEDALAEIVKPTAESVRNCLDSLKSKIASN